MRREEIANRFGNNRHSIIPCLLLAPVVVALAHRFFGVNLIFPVQSMTSLSTYFQLSIFPAIILLFGSGFFGVTISTVARETLFWKKKSFVVVAQAYGIPYSQSLRKLVLLKGWVLCWSLCLPWIFGELVVVEAVFNAPGLGYQIWTLARNREIALLPYPILFLALVYVTVLVSSTHMHQKIGRRLESYA